MSDQIVSKAWQWSIVAMITSGITAAAAVAYLGVFSLIGGAFLTTFAYAGAAALAGVGTAWLARHREELIEG